MNDQPTPKKENPLEKLNIQLIDPKVTRLAGTQVRIPEHPEIQTPEQAIAYFARVSNPSNQANPENEKLIAYCLNNKHWSVFEQVHMTVEVVTSRAVSAQMLRHKFNWQEFSQRYASVHLFMKVEARKQDTKNRQNSIELTQEEIELDKWLKEQYLQTLSVAVLSYQQALEKGIAKEVARLLLPINTATTLVMTGNARSFIHYIDLRTGNGTQKEHKIIAEKIKEVFVQEYPIISKIKGYDKPNNI